jgi:hypothetical protein
LPRCVMWCGTSLKTGRASLGMRRVYHLKKGVRP